MVMNFCSERIFMNWLENMLLWIYMCVGRFLIRSCHYFVTFSLIICRALLLIMAYNRKNHGHKMKWYCHTFVKIFAAYNVNKIAGYPFIWLLFWIDRAVSLLSSWVLNVYILRFRLQSLICNYMLSILLKH